MRETVAKGDAPSSSKLRTIKAEERPDPDLKDMNLLANAAPLSAVPVSAKDPALGNVNEMVDVEDAFSDTTVNPLGRVVTEALLAVDAVGDVLGIPGNSSNGVAMDDNDLLADPAAKRQGATRAAARVRLAMVFP